MWGFVNAPPPPSRNGGAASPPPSPIPLNSFQLRIALIAPTHTTPFVVSSSSS